MPPSFRSKPHPLYPEPGAWVVGTRQRTGLPEIYPPEHGVSNGMTLDQVRDYVAYEGLGYCLCSFIAADKIKDPTLKKLWAEARQAMKKVIVYLDQPKKVVAGTPKIKPSTTIRRGL